MTIELDDQLHALMYGHAEQCAPAECCGLLVANAQGTTEYVPVPNLAANIGQFRMDPAGYAAAEDAGEVLAIVHSHPHASANPSLADRIGCEKSGLPWVIVGWPSGVIKQLEPEGFEAPYKGREFEHGVVDCYTLLQDYYRRELGLLLPDFDRKDGWWEDRPDHPAEDLYMQHFAEAGFVRVFGAPQKHDGFLIQVKSDRANHGAVYLGGGVMLHHPYGRLSEETLYGGYWLRHTLAMVRHISQLTPADAAPLEPAFALAGAA